MAKMSYRASQTFSSPGDYQPSASFRQSPGHGYGYTSPENGQRMMGLSYTGARPNGSNVNGFSSVQQGVWSPSAFGTGYGYGAKPAQGISTMDQKAAMAFNTASPVNKDQTQLYQASYTQHQQSPEGYPAVPSQPYASAQVYGHTQASMAAQYGRGVASSQSGAGYYQYSMPNSAQMMGRVHSGQQQRDYTSNGGYGESGGYYGGVGGQQGQAQAVYQNYGNHGAIGQQGKAGAGQAQGSRKMW